MTEFGIFNDEGCVERGFFSVADAKTAAVTTYAEDDGLSVSELCQEHDEQPYDTCEECYVEEGS